MPITIDIILRILEVLLVISFIGFLVSGSMVIYGKIRIKNIDNLISMIDNQDSRTPKNYIEEILFFILPYIVWRRYFKPKKHT